MTLFAIDNIQKLLDYGGTLTITAAILLAIWRTGSWIGKKLFDGENGILTRAINAHIQHVEKLTTNIQDVSTNLKEQTKLLSNIKGATSAQTEVLSELTLIHQDPQASFSTVKTNKGIVLHSRMIQRLAVEMGVNVEDLMKEIQRELDRNV